MNLKDKAISIKGKKYVLVSDRVLFFNQEYPNGSIVTELVSDPTAEMVVIKATVTPDVDKPERKFTGYSQAVWGEGMVNKTAALENAETSAVGRALGMMGIGVLDSIASADEVNKAVNTNPSDVQRARLASDKQVSYILKLAKKVGKEVDFDKVQDLTSSQASQMIEKLRSQL